MSNSSRAPTVEDIDSGIQNMSLEPIQRPKTALQLRAEKFIKELGYRLPTQDEIVTNIGFTQEELALREHSIATTLNADEFHHVDEEYCMSHLTERGEATIRKFYTALEARAELRGLIIILTKADVLANINPLIIAGPLAVSDKFKQAPVNKLFLFANQEGIVYLHMRVSSVIGNVWKSYYFKSERMNNLQSFCFIVMEAHIANLKSIHLERETEQKAIEFSRREEELAQQAQETIKAIEAKAKKEIEEAKMVDKKTIERLRSIKKKQLLIGPTGLFYLLSTPNYLTQGLVKPGCAADIVGRIASYNVGKAEGDKMHLVKWWAVHDGRGIEMLIKAKFINFRVEEDAELLNCNPHHLIQYANAACELDKLGIELSNASIESMLSEEPSHDYSTEIKFIEDLSEVPSFKDGKPKRKSVSKRATDKVYLDQMSNEDFRARVIEIYNDFIIGKHAKPIAEIDPPAKVLWKEAQKPFKKEISPESSLSHIKNALVPIINSFKSHVECVWRNSPKKH